MSLSTSVMELPQVSMLSAISAIHHSSLFMTAPQDFNADVLTLSFDEKISIACAQIPIEDDIISEELEHFTVFLTSDDPSVVLLRQMANIIIFDDDKVTIGFEMEVYTVNEDQEFVDICVEIIEGVLQNEIGIRLTTKDIDTEAPNDYANISMILTFDNGMDKQCVNIILENDMILENNETFEVLLDRLDDTRVILMPERAEVIIIDDDGK